MANDTVENSFPPWAENPFRTFFRYAAEIKRFRDLCETAITSVSDFAPDRETLGEDYEEWRKAFEDEVMVRDFFEQEQQHGFPRLNAHAVIEMWSALESLVQDLAVVWLVNIPGIRDNPQFQKVRVRLAIYESLGTVEERMKYLLRELESDSQHADKEGVQRFETTLGLVGLSGPVPDDIRRPLFEMQQVRNVIAHRASIADRRLAEACPWIDITEGTPLRISESDYDQYETGTLTYALVLLQRALGRFDADFSPQQWLNELLGG